MNIMCSKNKNTSSEIFSDICLKNLDYFRKIKLPNIPSISDKLAVYIECQRLPHSEVIIRNAIYQLGDDWSHTIITGPENYAYYKKMAIFINSNILVINIGINNIINNNNNYNNLLLTHDFWNKLSGEKILIYQSNSFIFKNNILEFLEWDYIGSPFPNKNISLGIHQVGNGGLSLRSKSKMLTILDRVNLKENNYSKLINNYKKRINFDNYPEDIVFSQNMQTMGIGKVADYETAKKFSTCMVYSDDSFGMDCMWNGNKNWEKILNSKITEIFLKKEKPNVKVNYFNDELYLNKIEDFCKIVNVSKNHVLNDSKQEFRYFCYRYLDYIKMLYLPIIKQNSFYEAVLIEFRCLPHLEFLIRNSINKLGEKWSQTVVCGLNNYKFIYNIVKNIDRKIKIIKLDYENLTQIEYNDLLLTKSFWELFYGEKLLIYQEDSCIFKNNIQEFLNWDYIGAPWPLEFNINKLGVGNGGFSLRTKKVMLECLKYDDSKIELSPIISNYMNEAKLTRIPEDVYFTNIMDIHSIGKIADWENAKKFSSEGIHSDSLGGHQFWLNNTNWKNYLYSNIIKTFIPTHMTNLEHRGGWSNIINYLYALNVYNINANIVFYDVLEKDFIWENTIKDKKWFGVVHCTENTPSYLYCINISQLFEPNSLFLNHINECLFLIGMSPNIVNYLKNQFTKLNINVDVYLLYHPINNEVSIPKFSIKTLFDKECEYLEIENININDVEMRYTDTFKEYDDLLSENIVFIDLFDASANNTVLECILRRTPIIVNKLPSVVYYLGENYPLYFNSASEVPKLLTLENITKAHAYLMDLKLTSVKEFIADIINIINSKK